MDEASFENPSDDELREIYDETSTIAVVGASANPGKPAFAIPRQLKDLGYRIVPVNPKGGEIHGERAYGSLDEVDVPIDVVDVFRPAEETPDIARQAVKAGAKVLWLQEGIVSDEAAAVAREGGLTVVMGICMGHTARRLGISPRRPDRD
ncbi:MAG: CoA-binding protein [Actinomycetota bacterium]